MLKQQRSLQARIRGLEGHILGLLKQLRMIALSPYAAAGKVVLKGQSLAHIFSMHGVTPEALGNVVYFDDLSRNLQKIEAQIKAAKDELSGLNAQNLSCSDEFILAA